jgi:hypothetical protein
MSFNNIEGTDHVTQLSDDELIAERDAIETKCGAAPSLLRDQFERQRARDGGLNVSDYVRYAAYATYALGKLGQQLDGHTSTNAERETLARYATIVGELLVRMRESG